MMTINALQTVAIGLGILGFGTGVWALFCKEKAQHFSRNFPRNDQIGRVLMLIDVVWSLYLFQKMKLGDWDSIKPVIPICGYHFPLVYLYGVFIYLFIIRYVNHYLGARSLALFLILAAKPIVNICFLRDEPLRLIITSLAYFWVVIGICFAVAPHWMRNMIEFWQASPSRWAWGCRMKIIFGLFLIGLGWFVY